MSLVGRSVICTYCTKTLTLDAQSRLPDHRAPGAVCYGSGRAVASLDRVGRAVFASAPALRVGDRVRESRSDD